MTYKTVDAANLAFASDSVETTYIRSKDDGGLSNNRFAANAIHVEGSISTIFISVSFEYNANNYVEYGIARLDDDMKGATNVIESSSCAL